MNLVYNEHVEMVEVPIKPSDRLRVEICSVSIISYLPISKS